MEATEIHSIGKRGPSKSNSLAGLVQSLSLLIRVRE